MTKISAKYGPQIATCTYATCTKYVALVVPNWGRNFAWNPTHEAPILKKAEAIKKIKKFIEEKVEEKLRAEGKEVKGFRWGAPDCYCAYADDCFALYVITEE